MLIKLIQIFLLTAHPAYACKTEGALIPDKFQASSAKSYSELMKEAMLVMDRDMDFPPSKNGDADFLAMMIAHHQGAVDMAQAVILHSQKTELKNFAMQIISEQKNEIELMKIWQKKYAKK